MSVIRQNTNEVKKKRALKDDGSNKVPKQHQIIQTKGLKPLTKLNKGEEKNKKRRKEEIAGDQRSPQS